MYGLSKLVNASWSEQISVSKLRGVIEQNAIVS